MIAKRITRTSGDRYGRLARYLAAASDEGEKLDRLWLAGCDAGEDGEAITADDLDMLDMAIAEIEATQAMNSRATGDKTYHLILSFRDEKPDPEALIDIEAQFAAALGFAEHQRVVATHSNTDNFHMHVAFNKIHPTTLRCVTPFQDFKALEATCRAVEAQYGLGIDNGRADILAAIDEGMTKSTLSPAARDYEAHTWEQSFERFVTEKLPELEDARSKAASWQDLHDAFANYDLGLKLRGNGLVIYDAGDSADKSRHMKASSLARQFSKAALEKQLGAFQEPTRRRSAKKPKTGKASYARKPMTMHRGQNKLWQRYINHTMMKATRGRRDSLSGRLFRSWKAFLQAEAINDPLAMAIIIGQRKLIEGVTLGR